METYRGYVRTPLDAIILFEACRIGILPRVQRRLSEKERQAIKSGSIFVWDEREAGMRRWTDGKSWSASRVSGSFLTYREMEGRQRSEDESNHESLTANNQHNSEDSSQPTDGYRYKPDGLMKQSFSVTTSTNLKLHLISYFTRSQNDLIVPSEDINLKNITIPKGLYPDASAPLDQRHQQPQPQPHPYYTQQTNHHLQQNPPQYNANATTTASPPSHLHHHAHHPQPPPPPPATLPPPPHTMQIHQPHHHYHHTPPTRNENNNGPPPRFSTDHQDASRPKMLPIPTNNSNEQRQHQTNNTLPPPHHGNLNAKEIPYEKIVWGEDARAIQVLDRRFIL